MVLLVIYEDDASYQLSSLQLRMLALYVTQIEAVC